MFNPEPVIRAVCGPPDSRDPGLVRRYITGDMLWAQASPGKPRYQVCVHTSSPL